MTREEWERLGPVGRLEAVANDIVMDERYRAAIDEACDLLRQAGWGNPIFVQDLVKSYESNG